MISVVFDYAMVFVMKYMTEQIELEGGASKVCFSFFPSFFLSISVFLFFLYLFPSFFLFFFFFLMQFFFNFLVLFVLHVCLLVFFFFSLFVLLGVSKSPQIRCTCIECESVFYVAQWFELCFLVLTLNTPLATPVFVLIYLLFAFHMCVLMCMNVYA